MHGIQHAKMIFSELFTKSVLSFVAQAECTVLRPDPGVPFLVHADRHQAGSHLKSTASTRSEARTGSEACVQVFVGVAPLHLDFWPFPFAMCNTRPLFAKILESECSSTFVSLSLLRLMLSFRR